MKILINALSATNRSSRHVLDTWLAKHDARLDDVTLVVHPFVAADFAYRDPITVRGPFASWWGRRLWERKHIPRIAREQHVDEILHFGGFPLANIDVPQTAFLHNPVPFLRITWERPESRVKPLLQRMAYRNTLRHADRYLVPSTYMRDLVLQNIPDLGMDDFDVRPHALGDDLTGLTHEPPGDGPFILVAAGCWAPHKDLQSTFRLLRDLRQKRGLDARLVVIGEWANERYRRHVMAHPSLAAVRPHVRFAGFLSRTEYLESIRTAHLFVSTSHAESFGIPAHEAAAMGVPVVHSSGPIIHNSCLTNWRAGFYQYRREA